MDIKVSVVIPAYNRGDIISETLDSVLAQSLVEWECIVVDDGSTDTTEAVLQTYVEKDARFKYIHRPADRQKGGNTCRNIGLELARGEYVQFLDSDDLIAPNKFEEQVKVLSRSDLRAVATCKWGRFRTLKDHLASKPYEPTYINTDGPLELLDVFGKHSIWFPPHVYLARKSLIEEAGYWNEELKMNQDGEFFSRVLLAASEIIFVPETEVYYRRHTGGNTSSWNKEEKVRSVIHSWILVDRAIEDKLGISNHSYVKQARNLIYDKIKYKFPAIIREYQDFFNLKRSRTEEFYMKVNSRLQLMYLRKLKGKF
ncbi:glycosyl transferase family protein [Flammeovirgaceae bacterium 311]|nr:glycosyl transferase family protein [Flammeovirgaceae bacterium 311]